MGNIQAGEKTVVALLGSSLRSSSLIADAQAKYESDIISPF